jgi:5-hydroxyisourate hydrolase
MPLSTHVLDVAHGVPACELAVTLCRVDGDDCVEIVSKKTDADGRIAAPFGGELSAGTYELVFAVGAYYTHHDVETLFGDVAVRIRVSDPKERYHIPLLLSPWSYTTYRGS